MFDRSLSLLVAAALAACSSGAQDMENVCYAAERSGTASMDPDNRATATWEWIEKTVRDKGVLRDLRSLGSYTGADKGALLREIAKEHGYTGPCPMADLVDGPAR